LLGLLPPRFVYGLFLFGLVAALSLAFVLPAELGGFLLFPFLAPSLVGPSRLVKPVPVVAVVALVTEVAALVISVAPVPLEVAPALAAV
jgi:hypothetical protein